MLSSDQIENLLHLPGVSNLDRLLFCLGSSPLRAQAVTDIRMTALNAGWTGAKSINVSEYLRRAKGLAILTPHGWKLTDAGKKHVATRAVVQTDPTAVAPVASKLRGLLGRISNVETRAFVEEAVRSFEHSLFRSAVVLSWVGAIAVLYDHVISKALQMFNAEAARRDRGWKAATTRDDLARMKEHDFLQVLSAISVIGKSVKDELEGALKLRNGAGHPNSLQIGENRAAAHIESLIGNVYGKF